MMSDDGSKTPKGSLLSRVEPSEVGEGLGSGRIERRLAAFLALDIKNYSLMISRDEAAAHKRVGKDLATVVRQIHKHGGHILQFSGDGLLAEFRQRRVTLQSALESNRRPANETVVVRRITRSSTGSASMLAKSLSRTAALAATRSTSWRVWSKSPMPGGICISDTVFAQVHRTVKATFTNLGAARLKNIRHPVTTYRVSWPPGRPSERRARIALPRSCGADALDYRPSIAILPLENLDGDGASDYFSDGVVEDVIVSLAGLRELRLSRGPRPSAIVAARPMFGTWAGHWASDTCCPGVFAAPPPRSAPRSN